MMPSIIGVQRYLLLGFESIYYKLPVATNEYEQITIIMSFYKLHVAHAKSISLFVVSIIAFTPFSSLHAEEDLFFEMPVVLSASRLEQPISETPVAVTSIDRQIIEASGARTIPEVLRLVPGIVVGTNANEWGEEAKIVVAYHGHTDQYSKQMQVLIDGRSIYEPLLGGVNWNMLPINIEDIERIEVSRGPNASTYGSNSFLAVINIITRHASEDQGHYAKLRLGNHSIADATYRYGGSDENIDYRVTLTTQNDDGLDARKNLNTYDANGDVINRQYSDESTENDDGISTGAIDYRIDYQLSNKSRFTYQGAYGKTKLEIKENYAFSGIRPERDSNTTNFHQFVKLENVIDDDNSYVVQYSYNLQNKIDQSISKLIQVGGGIDDFTLDLDFGFKSERHNLEVTHFNQTTDNLRLVWGASVQQEIAKSEYWVFEQGTIREEIYRLFGNAEWQINKNNLLNFGALLEENKAHNTDLSPRLTLIHKLNDKHSIRLGVSRAMRSPFIGEKYSNTSYSHDLTSGGSDIGVTLTQQVTLPNKDLDHETIISREIGYFGQLMDDKLFISARLFYDRLDNVISTLRINNLPDTIDNFDNSALIYTNIASTDITGLEFEFDFRSDKSMRYYGNVTHLHIDSNDTPKTNLSIEYEKSAPEWTASLMAIKQFNDNYSGSLEFHYIGQMSWLDVPDNELNEDNDYRTLDLRLSKSSRQSGSTSKISLLLKNLLGEYSSYNQAPDDGPLVEHNLTGYIEYSILFN